VTYNLVTALPPFLFVLFNVRIAIHHTTIACTIIASR
jgi:hypothetical protein